MFKAISTKEGQLVTIQTSPYVDKNKVEQPGGSRDFYLPEKPKPGNAPVEALPVIGADDSNEVAIIWENE